jgi:hypothetical protein
MAWRHRREHTPEHVWPKWPDAQLESGFGHAAPQYPVAQVHAPRSTLWPARMTPTYVAHAGLHCGPDQPVAQASQPATVQKPLLLDTRAN